MTNSWMLVVGAFALAAAFTDWRWRRVPRSLALAAATAGLAYHGLAGGELSALAATAVGLGLGVALLQVGAIGGGDAKWLAALGALLGLRLWFWSLEFGLLAAAAVAVAQFARRGELRLLPGHAWELIAHLRFWGWRPHPRFRADNQFALRAPFAVALSLGVGCALALPLVIR